jgi:hypothetical protein
MIFKEIYKSFIRVNGYLLSSFSLLIALLLFFVTPTTDIPVRWVVVFAVPFFLLFIVVCDVAYCAIQDIVLPKVKASREPSSLYPNALAILLLEKSNLFGHESLVSVYFKGDDFETLIGVGYVLNIQQGGLIQVLVIGKVGEAQDDTWEKIRNNNGDILSKLLIRPSITKIMQDIGV